MSNPDTPVPGAALSTTPASDEAQTEVVDLCAELIRFDTSNPTSDERACADWVVARLSEAGIESTLVESAPGRANVIARIPGTDPTRGALLVHGHLDVVPADATEWQVPPFSGEIHDGYLWGRGAIDMKDTVAVMLATARHFARTGTRPAREIVLAFLADEEAGGKFGAHWLVEHRPELFAGVTEAIGEGGGFSYALDDTRRLYPIENAQRGMAWMELTANGRAGHGSSPNDENAVTDLAESLTRIGRHSHPVRLIEPVRALLAKAAELLGVEIDFEVLGTLDQEAVDKELAKLGHVADFMQVVLRNSANPTMFSAGYQTNVIPGKATARVDGRFLPGHEQELIDTIDALLLPSVSRQWVNHDIAMETSFDGPLVDAMCAAVRAEDPDGHPVPYCNPGGTDAKAFTKLDIRCFGFKGLKLPHDLDYGRLFHGVDERVPLEGLRFGVRVMTRLWQSC
ncbi:M20/M25/M40 family metallo-hydrolase [Streptomyces durmitorensis]|uniref:M20/M25/M40 family metallo-hydrolase n=1 Tax=Streptomyces durmitorensis TaxID=319947 RepID=A0ABY4Q611_9ACTN|nr:M20/M25/M40 family metallo-hydrolase [Streptomyces durmitorensis]UQT61145.1 M20/M25/M40 family metallo-hydrolase [Streptomyces durmitorensis]